MNHTHFTTSQHTCPLTCVVSSTDMRKYWESKKSFKTLTDPLASQCDSLYLSFENQTSKQAILWKIKGQDRWHFLYNKIFIHLFDQIGAVPIPKVPGPVPAVCVCVCVWECVRVSASVCVCRHIKCVGEVLAWTNISSPSALSAYGCSQTAGRK